VHSLSLSSSQQLSVLYTVRPQLTVSNSVAESKQKLDQKDQVIQEQSHKMEEMAAEFGKMLEDTLKKMTDRIEVSSKNYEDDPADEGGDNADE
jgi:gas vesicle protein